MKTMKNKFKWILIGFVFSFVLGGNLHAEEPLTGKILIDGSSTVYPISEAVAEEFRKVQPKVKVSIGFSGTGGGFKKFLLGETDINDASRPIKSTELEKAKAANIEFFELPVAYDGIAVVVHPQNSFVDYLTTEELKKIWEPSSQVKKWSQVRAGWPDQEIKLYGPGTDSGTFDYFTEAINGKSQSSRADFTASEDDNVLVRGISQDPFSLGYFGFAYYHENSSKLKLVPIKHQSQTAIAPSQTTINDGSYQPLSRPIFIYVKKASVQKTEVKAFVDFYLNNAPQLASSVGYVGLPQKINDLVLAKWKKQSSGTAFLGIKNANLESLLK